jgi:ABC-2 type transport system permease protein
MYHPSQNLKNIWHLCWKEWQSLLHDKIMVCFILFAFTGVVYMQAEGSSMELQNATVGVVDEDQSPLSHRIVDALRPPYFGTVNQIKHQDVDRDMEQAKYTFVLQIPTKFEADLRAGKSVTVQLLIDATVLGQSGIGAQYIDKIIQMETARYLNRPEITDQPVKLIIRYAYNEGQNYEWFGGIASLIQNITMLAILLTGAALLRERESGTIEHLLVMPITPTQIVLSKIIANGLVILLVVFLSVMLVLRKLIGIQIGGSISLFLFVTGLYLCFCTGLGIFLGTMVRTMPQLGLLYILLVLPMNLLSGGFTPLESMPVPLQKIMAFVPSTSFVSMSQAILFRGAGIEAILREIAIVVIVGVALLIYSITRFRRFLEQQG